MTWQESFLNTPIRDEHHRWEDAIISRLTTPLAFQRATKMLLSYYSLKTYRAKFNRTVIVFPFCILLLFVPGVFGLPPWVVFTICCILFLLQLGYNFVTMQNEESNSNDSQKM